MPLSEEEQRLLEQMEEALAAEDPKFASALRGAASRQHHKRIMFVRTDDGSVDGVFRTDGYVDARRFDAAELASFIHERALIAS